MFELSQRQQEWLAALRAWREEGERRFEFWSRREAHSAAARAFAEALARSGLAPGKTLTEDARAGLLGAASALAPNANLSRRLYAQDAADFDRRLSTLLLGVGPIYDRLAGFLVRRGAGAQTASGLLCALAPDTYPLITRAGLRRLGLSAAQKRDALQEAADRYGFALPDGGPPPAAALLLALFVVYEQVRDTLGLALYPEVEDALRADAPAAPEPHAAARVREPGAAYSPAPPPALTETRLLAILEDYALAQGFTFPPYRLRAYYVALKTKPFVLLSGVSGTGKTRLAELFAEAMTGSAPRQFRLIPVRPDWADAAPLMGYQNVLAGRYVSTPFLEIARAAGLPENRRKAFFVCLDEMNLARAEHYLADYLSALESRAHRIPLHEGVPDLVLPPNLFLTGTVNIDETTHGFSRKVLDRANTFEFDEAPDLARSAERAVAGSAEATSVQRQALFLAARVTGVGQARERLAQVETGFPGRALATLEAVNGPLYAHRLHFAYRVRDDVLMFLANSFDAQTGNGLLVPDQEENFRLALDLQLLQKVLPKLHGQSEAVTPLLSRLEAWAAAEELPRTRAKLARMRAHGEETGYVRFYE